MQMQTRNQRANGKRAANSQLNDGSLHFRNEFIIMLNTPSTSHAPFPCQTPTSISKPTEPEDWMAAESTVYPF